MSEKEKSASPRQEDALSKSQPAKHTKKSRILELLKAGTTLNRFEAEHHGDHALNSTISILRAEGNNIVDEWEYVPTRFAKEVHVKRYAYAGAQ